MARKIDLDKTLVEEPLELTIGGDVYTIPYVSVDYVMRLQGASESVSGSAATEALIEMLSPLGVPRDKLLAWSYQKALAAATEIAQHFTSLPATRTETPPGVEEEPSSSGPTPSPSSSTPSDVPTE